MTLSLIQALGGPRPRNAAVKNQPPTQFACKLAGSTWRIAAHIAHVLRNVRCALLSALRCEAGG